MHNDPLPTKTEGCGALVPVGRTRSSGGAVGVHVSAAFVTQLIACRGGLPAYRARRRAEPREATRLYAEREAAPVAPARRSLSL